MNANAIQAWLEANGIRQLTRMPVTHDWRVCLTCGGPSGFGETIAEALDNARDLNAGFLEAA